MSLVCHPRFTPDSKFIVCHASDNLSVFIHSAATGTLFRTISLEGEEGGYVVDVVPHPTDSKLVIALTSSGDITIWDFETISLVEKKVRVIGCPTQLLVRINPEKQEELQVYCLTKEDTKLNTVYRVGEKQNERMLRLSGLDESVFAVNPQKPGIALAVGPIVQLLDETTKATWEFDCKAASMSRSSKKHNARCLKYHPTQNWLSIGLSSGAILTLLSLDEPPEGETTLTRTQHWHAHDVADMEYTSDGLFLLSVGEEGVAVVWNSYNKEVNFAPRLGGAISHVTCSQDCTLYLILSEDNGIRLIDASTRQARRVMVGVRLKCKSTTRPIIEPHTNRIVVGVNGILQFISPFQQKADDELEVAPRNMIGRDNKGPIDYVRVEHACFSKDGKHLLTCDSLQVKDEVKTSLRFWHHTGELTKRWARNTIVSNSHSDQVTCLSFAGFSNESEGEECTLFASGSLDGSVKVWKGIPVVVDDEKKKRSPIRWVLNSVLGLRNLPCRDASFSSDGSVFCAFFGDNLTLWNSETYELLHELSYRLPRKPTAIITATVHPIPNSKYVVVRRSRHIVVWDLTDLCVHWCVVIDVVSLDVDPTGSGHFSVLSENGWVTLFHAAKPVPKQLWKGDYGLAIWWKTTDSAEVSLIALNKKKGFQTLYGKQSQSVTPTLKLSEADVPMKFVHHTFEPIRVVDRGQHIESKVTNMLLQDLAAPAQKNNKLLDAPSHALPSVNKLFTPFMEELLTKQATEQQSRGSEMTDNEAQTRGDNDDVVSVDLSLRAVMGEELSVLKPERDAVMAPLLKHKKRPQGTSEVAAS